VKTHVHRTAIVCLGALELEEHLHRSAHLVTGPAESVSVLDQRESRIMANLEAFKKRKRRGKNTFPVKCHRVKTFQYHQCLKELRLFKRASGPCNHAPILIADDAKRMCSLCSGVRKTRYECSTCKVPLCINHRRNGSGAGGDGNHTHFHRWHNAVDLSEERQKATEETRQSKADSA